MEIDYREAQQKDRNFILNANKEINILSGLNDSTFENNIDKDLFKDKICKSIVASVNNEPIGFILYSYIYWANCGKGIYISQAYVKNEFRQKGILKALVKKLEENEPECNFITNLVGSENKIMIKALKKLNFESSDLITFYKTAEK